MMSLINPGPHSRWLTFFAQALLWVPGVLFFLFFFRLKVHDREQVRTALRIRRKGQGVIFAANHISEFDGEIIVSALVPWSSFFPLFFVAKAVGGYKDKGLRGRLLYNPSVVALFGGYPLNAQKGNYAASLERHVKLLQRGYSLGIFPTGKVSAFEEPLPAHGGLGYLMEAAKPIVIPVQIRGAYRPSFYKIFFRKMHTSLTFGVPQPSEAYLDETLPVPERYQRASEKVLKEILSL